MSYTKQGFVDGQVLRAANLNHMEAGIVTAVDGRYRPNLLDNWYFANPVNQRGQTEYPVAGYTIDRWKNMNTTDQSTTLVSEGLKLSGTAYKALQQCVANPEELNGRTVTFSALVRNPNGKFRAAIYNDSTKVSFGSIDISASTVYTLITVTGVPEVATGEKLSVLLYPGSNDASTARDAYVLAAKLEIGDTQSLAYQDQDGDWLLRDIPDYGEQLARCQRYCYIFDAPESYSPITFAAGITTIRADALITTPVSMRAKPTISKSGDFGLFNGSTVPVTALSVDGWAGNIVRIQATVESGLTKGQSYHLRANNSPGAKIILSTDL